MKFALTIVMLFGLAFGALAVQPDEVLDDPLLEARARELSAELRCVQCQSESIDASDASIAKDLRIVLREKLVEGLTDEEIKTYMSDRYGEFILLKPRFAGSTALLWLLGPLMLLFGGLFVFVFIRNSGAVKELDDD